MKRLSLSHPAFGGLIGEGRGALAAPRIQARIKAS